MIGLRLETVDPRGILLFKKTAEFNSGLFDESGRAFVRVFAFMNFCDFVVVFANASIRVLFSHSLIHVCAHMLCLCVCICSSILADCLYFCVRMCMLASVPLSVCISASGYACILGVCFLFLSFASFVTCLYSSLS